MLPLGEWVTWGRGLIGDVLELVPPWIIRLVEKWLFGWFYLIFSGISWVLGGGLWRWILHNALFLVGAYYVASIAFDFIAHWAVEKIESAELSRNPAIGDLMMRARYPPYARAIYNKYKDWKVRQLIIGRQPVGGFVNKVINFFSAGYWQDIRDQIYKSGLNHVSLYAIIESPQSADKYKIIRIDKNDIVGISEEFKINAEMSVKNVSGVSRLGLTLEQFLEPAHQDKAKYTSYKIMDNNCQGFTYFLLEAHGLASPELHDYIVQDLGYLNKSLPAFVIPTSNIVMFLLRFWSYIVYLN